MTDAISHTVLLGIVFGFMLVGNLNSPILILMATLMGVFTTYLIELLVKSKRQQKMPQLVLFFRFFLVLR